MAKILSREDLLSFTMGAMALATGGGGTRPLDEDVEKIVDKIKNTESTLECIGILRNGFKILSITADSTIINENTKFEPCIIQSAFLFENGKRIIIYTGALGIISYECDENWNTHKKPFATCLKKYMRETPTEYHQKIRKIHGEEKLVKEHSTTINW